MKNILFDVETDGLLPELSRIHSLWLMDVDTGYKMDFAQNDSRNDIEEGLDVLSKAETVIGHNIMGYDLLAIDKCYPNFELNPDCLIRDTLVMSRMMFANIKDSDFEMAKRDKIPGRLIGAQGLEAWGYRTGTFKGDYAKVREQQLKDKHKEEGLESPTKEEIRQYVWGKWNPDMHEYCSGDLDTNYALWLRLVNKDWDPFSIAFEHQVHDLMVQQEVNGFYFNTNKAKKLAEHLQAEYNELSEKAIKHIGVWWRAQKYHEGSKKVKAEDGENYTRRTWGDITVPKATRDYSKSNADKIAIGDYQKLRANTIAGAPFVKVTRKEFNPNSRQQIVDRLTVLYGWTPQDFTEKGSAIVDDEILRDLSSHIPLAHTLAEIFFYKKRLGQVLDGQNAWLKLVDENDTIHPVTNCGGTVSGRATHSRPNISQVPGVHQGETKEQNAALTAAWRLGVDISTFRYNARKGQWSWTERGREGQYGWECRELFEARPGNMLMGCDLSGIEFRCLANLTYPFDDGELVDVVLNGDIHLRNANLAGIDRQIAKRLLYACMYGGGDAKLGSIVEPLSDEARQRTLGKQLRTKLMSAMPSLEMAIKQIQQESRMNGGRIKGMDGRWLYVRSPHSALNLRLQSDGAMIAKKWILLVDDMYYDEGWKHAVGAEYAFCAWSHDEIQVEVKTDLAERAARLAEEAAPLAGGFFNFHCPVAAEAKIGRNWAETH